MAFDLKAATEAAQTEAQRAPFAFDWDGEHFEVPSMSQWPLEISAGFTELGAGDVEDVDPARVLALIAEIIGPAEFPRFRKTVPMDALPVLVTEMARTQLGGTVPDLSPPPGPVSTPT